MLHVSFFNMAFHLLIKWLRKKQTREIGCDLPPVSLKSYVERVTAATQYLEYYITPIIIYKTKWESICDYSVYNPFTQERNNNLLGLVCSGIQQNIQIKLLFIKIEIFT